METLAERHEIVASSCKPSDPDDCVVECSCGQSGSDAWFEAHRDERSGVTDRLRRMREGYFG